MAEETMQVRLKATPQADAITIKKSEYDPKLHTAVNPDDVAAVPQDSVMPQVGRKRFPPPCSLSDDGLQKPRQRMERQQRAGHARHPFRHWYPAARQLSIAVAAAGIVRNQRRSKRMGLNVN